MGICKSKREIEEERPNPNFSNQNSNNNITPALSIPKVSSFTNINNKIINTNYQNNPQIIIKSESKNNEDTKQVSIQEGIDFLTKGALVCPYDLDNNYHYIYTSGNPKLIGPTPYQRLFIPPIGWTAIALKVSQKYDNGDDKWLNEDWYIGYHGVKSMISINNILYKGFRKGPNQLHKDKDNINSLSKNASPKCKEGVYFAQNINEAKWYSEIIPYSGKKYRAVFMCRLNPMLVRIASIGQNNDYMITNGDEIDDIHGTPKINEVRPYKILLRKE